MLCCVLACKRAGPTSDGACDMDEFYNNGCDKFLRIRRSVQVVQHTYLYIAVVHAIVPVYNNNNMYTVY